MSREVHKFALPAPGVSVELVVPLSFKPLHVALQQGFANVWAEVETSEVFTKHVRIYAIGTGWMIPDEAQHIGTIVDDLHGFVWHYYMRQT